MFCDNYLTHDIKRYDWILIYLFRFLYSHRFLYFYLYEYLVIFFSLDAIGPTEVSLVAYGQKPPPFYFFV